MRVAAQVGDEIMIDGRDRILLSNPLELFWEKTGRRKPAFMTSETCRRGYIARWELSDEKLYLVDIKGKIQKSILFFHKWVVPCSLKLIGLKNTRGKVFADWFSGKLRIPIGKMTLYVHHGYDSRFERELIVTIDHGRISKMVTLDFTKRKLQVVNMP